MPLLPLLVACADVTVPMNGAEESFAGSAIDAPTGTADWHVDGAGGSDFETIQEAIDAASPGQWILVAPGTYSERINYNGKSLWISSRDGSAATTIDATRRGTGVTVVGGETSRTALVGFTIENAVDYGVQVDFSSIHLEDVRITGASGAYGIHGSSADLELQDVTIDNNDANYAAIYMDRGSLQMTDSSVECGNGYTIYSGHGYMQIDQSTITCNGRNSYAIAVEHTVGTVLRSTLTGQVYVSSEDDHNTDTIALVNSVLNGDYTAVYGTILIRNSVIDGGKVTYWDFAENPATPVIENSILLNSTCAFATDALTNTVRNNSFWNTTPSCGTATYIAADGNLDADPLLTDAPGGDYHLDGGSPLEDAGVDEDTYDDIDGSRGDIGPFGGVFTMDGGW
ncbi:hypothetical protein LBMAG42_17400 [Deltaproteobacteria bacterium]|nr:hypothetical protein LBMAG42_17400 [Deltaproteobacteria bacterium]